VQLVNELVEVVVVVMTKHLIKNKDSELMVVVITHKMETDTPEVVEVVVEISLQPLLQVKEHKVEMVC
jgi:hypothetical protein